MELACMEISSKSVTKSSEAFTTKNAWARYVRRRWGENALKKSMIEWDLTEGRARGLLYANVTQSTIDQILDHPNGGFALGLEILVIKTGLSLEGYIEQQAGEAAHERARIEAKERALASLQTRLGRLSAERSFLPRRPD